MSEVLGSLLMVAITLTAGAAVFGFVNGQSGVSAGAVGSSAAANINFLNEREVIAYAAMFGPSPSSSARIWVYNSGSISPESMSKVLVYDVQNPTNACTVDVSAQANSKITTGSVSSITVDLPSVPTTNPPCANPFQFQTSHSYVFRVIGQYGSSAQLTVKV